MGREKSTKTFSYCELVANDKLVGTQTLLSGTTNVEWNDLSINDENGNKIVYTVKADEVEEYEISYQGLDITLTHTSDVTPNPEPPVNPEQPVNSEPPVQEDKPNVPSAPHKQINPYPEVGELPQTGVSNDATMALDLVLLGGIILLICKKKQSKVNKTKNTSLNRSFFSSQNKIKQIQIKTLKSKAHFCALLFLWEVDSANCLPQYKKV